MRFGTEAGPAAVLIGDIDSIERLREAGRWIIECRSADELRERIETAQQPQQLS